jgi:hypothetical protein
VSVTRPPPAGSADGFADSVHPLGAGGAVSWVTTTVFVWIAANAELMTAEYVVVIRLPVRFAPNLRVVGLGLDDASSVPSTTYRTVVGEPVEQDTDKFAVPPEPEITVGLTVSVHPTAWAVASPVHAHRIARPARQVPYRIDLILAATPPTRMLGLRPPDSRSHCTQMTTTAKRPAARLRACRERRGQSTVVASGNRMEALAARGATRCIARYDGVRERATLCTKL